MCASRGVRLPADRKRGTVIFYDIGPDGRDFEAAHFEQVHLKPRSSGMAL
jgi:hypothetical protein